MMTTVVVIVSGCGLGIGTCHSHCTQVTGQSASVIRVGVAYVNVRLPRHLKEGLAWPIDRQLQLIINKMLFVTVIPLRIKRIKLFLI